MKARIAQALVLALAFASLNVGIPGGAARAETFTVTLKPGQQATIPFSFWCMDYGEPFPKAVETAGDRASDGVIAVVRAAVAKGVTESEPYQTQLAIWRETEGAFKDYANLGTVLAQEIFSDSLQVVVPPLPEGVPTLADVIAQGAITATVEGLTPTLITSPTQLPGEPFNGTGVLVLGNSSADTVRFVVPEGLAFAPVGGERAQRLVAEPRGQPELPETGSATPEMPVDLLLIFAAGAALAGLGVAIPLAGRLRRRQ
jgi:hypothetical protein